MSTPPTHTGANAFYAISPEIWEHIFSFACTDGGYTGCSLSLVSKRCYELSQSTRHHSVAIRSARTFVKFAALLRGMSAGSDATGGCDHLPPPAQSSSVSTCRPKVRHLYIKLGDLFFELAETREEDDDDDFIYTGDAPAPTSWPWEYPESDEEGWTSGDDDTSSDEGPAEGELDVENPKAKGTGDDDANLNSLDDDPEFLQAEVEADLEWMKTAEGCNRSSLVPEASDPETNFPPTLAEDCEVVEPQVLLLLRGVLASPCCVDSLESLTFISDLRHQIELDSLIPPLPKLKRLALRAVDLVWWGTFITTAPPIAQSVPTRDPIAHYPSLQTLRFSGRWNMTPEVSREDLLSFVRNHTPKLERLRAPIPALQYGVYMNEVLSPTDGFPTTLYDAIVEIEYPSSRQASRFNSDRLDDFKPTPKEDQERPVIPSCSNRRLVLVDERSLEGPDDWLNRWEEEVETDGCGSGGHDSKVWWNIPQSTTQKTSWRRVGSVGNWEVGLVTSRGVVDNVGDHEWRLVRRFHY